MKKVCSYQELTELVKQYPEQMNVFGTLLVENDYIFARVVKVKEDLINILIDFPSWRRAVFDFILDVENRSIFESLVTNLETFLTLIDTVPEFGCDILEYLLDIQNEYQFNQLVNGKNSLIQLMKRFPQHSAFFVQRLIRPDVFLTLITDYLDFGDILKQLGGYIPFFIEHVLNEEVLRERILGDYPAATLVRLGIQFPDYRSAFIKPLLQSNEIIYKLMANTDDSAVIRQYFPNDYKALTEHIFNNKEAFLGLTNDLDRLTALIGLFPKQQMDVFLSCLLNQPDQLRRLVSSANELRKLARYYPDVPELQGSFDTFFKRISERTIRNTVESLFQINQGFFKKHTKGTVDAHLQRALAPPAQLVKQVASLTADPQEHTYIEAVKIAAEAFTEVRARLYG